MEHTYHCMIVVGHCGIVPETSLSAATYKCLDLHITHAIADTSKGVPLIDWISDTRHQGCVDLQSLVKCLDHG